MADLEDVYTNNLLRKCFQLSRLWHVSTDLEETAFQFVQLSQVRLNLHIGKRAEDADGSERDDKGCLAGGNARDDKHSLKRGDASDERAG